MKRSLSIPLLALLVASPGLSEPLRAQADEEARFNNKQADLLHKFARDAFKKGFPRQARLFWLQAIKLYNPNHEKSRAGLGQVRSGSSWAPKAGFVYPTEDTGKGTDGQALFRKLKSLRKSLGSAHRSRAKRWAQAGRKDKADLHYRLVLRWIKNDSEAQKALNHKAVGDVTGTDLEQTLYDRSKMIEKAVASEAKKDYPVEEVVDSTNPVLEAAQLTYKTVKSEHYMLRGDHPSEDMKEALVWAERTLRVVKKAFEGDSGARADPRSWVREFAYFTKKEHYQQILQANGGQLRDLQWALEHSTGMTLSADGVPIRVGNSPARQVLFDATVRQAATSYAGYSSTGVNEGVGHTFVGMMFNNNRLFAVDRKKQEGTVASEEDREYQSPNFDIWKDLALEMAWKLTGGTPAMQIPRLTADKFSNEQRIKCWSFCDYMVRRDTKMLRDLDKLRGEKSPFDVEEKFNKAHDVTLKQLDREWEDFWTGASPVLQAIKNDTPPLAAVSRGVIKYLEAFNKVRKSVNAVPVTWSSNYSTRCLDHAQYLKLNKVRDLAGVQTQNSDLEKASHLGSMFAEMALVDIKASAGRAEKMFRSWLDVPGYRDALVHNYLRAIGVYAEGKILVINAVSGLGAPRDPKRAGYTGYPRSAQGIPAEVESARLGPEFAAAMQKAGQKVPKVVGYPITLHFGINVPGPRASYACTVSVRGEAQPGIIIDDSGKNRRSSAPGMMTFVPFKPLPKGKVMVAWAWEDGNGQPRSFTTDFTTK